MEMLEIIRLRSLDRGREELARDLLAGFGPAAREGVRLELYRPTSVGTDLSVHLHRPLEHGGRQASPLGLRLAAALREHGQVSHSIWSHVGRSLETSDTTNRRNP